jgi:hypothetical protein
VGARLSVSGQSWVVDAVATPGVNPTLVLRQVRNTASMNVDLDQAFCTVETWVSPRPGDRFLIAEHLDDPAAWDPTLTKEIRLAAFTPLHTETIVHADGQTRVVFVGGLTGQADVQAVPDADPAIAAFIPPGGPAFVPSGAYTVTFATAQLPALGDPDVEFHEGVIRLPDVDGTMKVLRVWRIGSSAATPQLELTVYDGELAWQRDAASGMFLLDGAHQLVPVLGCVPVRTGTVTANLHPSYRAWVRADLAGGRTFGEPAILPARGEGSRQTFMTARSRDSSLTPALTSPMAQTAPLLAFEMHDPVPPGPPRGPLFATRPGFFGKATYTFDVQVDDPHALIFFKANDRKILDRLYRPETVRAIQTELDALDPADVAFASQRWHDLVHVVTGADGRFLQHTPNGFRFPIPDNPGYALPDPRPHPPGLVIPFDGTTPPGSSAVVGATGRTMRDIVQGAIDGAFVPLTETPVVYRQLTDRTLQTSGRPPRVRDANGDPLRPDDPAYDAWPMAVRYEKDAGGAVLQHGAPGYGGPGNTRWVRFTDHTIDGAAKNVYFYYGVELARTMRRSARSPIAGPVQLVNTAPPEAPVIRKVTARLVNGRDVTAPRVEFSLSAALPSEGVTRHRLYRALDAGAARSVRTMTVVGEFPTGATDIQDDFGDLADAPFAQPIYYRTVALREIVNERGGLELVPSNPSAVAVTTVADAVNPAPPPITMVSDPLTGTSPRRYTNVRLRWPRTASHGRYHLFKLNPAGIWVKIHTVQSDASVIEVSLADTGHGSDALIKEDGAGRALYHRFRVMAENASGLFNLTWNESTV